MSKQYKLSKTDTENWIVNMKRFIAPVGILYLLQVTATVSMAVNSGDAITALDFFPNQVTQGGMILYVLNSALDVFTKWRNVS